MCICGSVFSSKILVKMLQFNIMSSSFSCVCFCILVLYTCAAKGANGEERTKNHWEDSVSKSIYSFGTELMKGLAEESSTNGNVFVSPLSAYLALSMVHLAMEKEARVKLNKILKISDSNTNVLHGNLSAVLQQIANKKRSNDPYITLPEVILSNGFFVDDAFPVSAWYMQQLKTYYGQNNASTVTNLNFEEDVKAIKIINSWISETTKNRIENFYSEPLSKDTRALLTSAIYFKAAWQKPFRPAKMKKFKTDQGEIQVQMMTGESYIPYYSNAALKFDSIELPYTGEEYAMMILLPHLSQTVSNLTQFIHLLDFKQYEEKQRIAGVEYKIPKMKMFFKKSLVEALQLTDILNDLELRVMTSDYENVAVKDVKQAAEIEVDENGTIATAVTVGEISTKMGTIFDREIQFVADRPFIIYIVHKPTYTLLFSGIVHDPTQSQIVELASTSGAAEEGPYKFFLSAVVQLLLIFCSKFLFN